MDIIVPGDNINIITPNKTVEIPDQYDDSALKVMIQDLDNRIDKLEAVQPTPVPIPPVTPGIAPPPFAATSIWNAKLADNAPLHAKNAEYKARFMWWLKNADPWFNANDKGTIVYEVDSSSPVAKIFNVSRPTKPNSLEIAQGINIPLGLAPSGGVDNWASIYNKTTDKLYDFWQLKWNNNHWECLAVGILNNASTSDGTFQRFTSPEYWNSSRCSHIPLRAGIVTADDLKRGEIRTALCFLAPKAAKDAWVYPAKSTDRESQGSTDYDVNAMPMGLRLRLPKSISIGSSLTPLTKMLIAAVRDRGMIMVDTTFGWSMSFMTEDSRRFGNTDILKPYMGGRAIWDILGTKAGGGMNGEFPYSQLQVLA